MGVLGLRDIEMFTIDYRGDSVPGWEDISHEVQVPTWVPSEIGFLLQHSRLLARRKQKLASTKDGLNWQASFRLLVGGACGWHMGNKTNIPLSGWVNLPGAVGWVRDLVREARQLPRTRLQS